jgi:hypothetical protein
LPGIVNVRVEYVHFACESDSKVDVTEFVEDVMDFKRWAENSSVGGLRVVVSVLTLMQFASKGSRILVPVDDNLEEELRSTIEASRASDEPNLAQVL